MSTLTSPKPAGGRLANSVGTMTPRMSFPFAPIPETLDGHGLKAGAKVLAAQLVRISNCHKQSPVFVSNKKLGAICECSPAEIKRDLLILEQAGFIRREHVGDDPRKPRKIWVNWDALEPKDAPAQSPSSIPFPGGSDLIHCTNDIGKGGSDLSQGVGQVWPTGGSDLSQGVGQVRATNESLLEDEKKESSTRPPSSPSSAEAVAGPQPPTSPPAGGGGITLRPTPEGTAEELRSIAKGAYKPFPNARPGKPAAPKRDFFAPPDFPLPPNVGKGGHDWAKPPKPSRRDASEVPKSSSDLTVAERDQLFAWSLGVEAAWKEKRKPDPWSGPFAIPSIFSDMFQKAVKAYESHVVVHEPHDPNDPESIPYDPPAASVDV